MPTFTITCPECDTALRSAGEIPAGKKVKCPSCEAVFVAPERKAESASVGIQEKPVRSAPARPIRDEVDEAAPRPRRRIRDEENEPSPRRRGRIRDEGEAPERPALRKQARASTDDDDIVTEEYREEDDFEEERPRKKRRKKKARRRSKKALLIVLSSVLITLVAAGGVAAYFIWFHGTNWGSGNEEPWTFVHPDANFIVSLDVAALLNDSGFGPQIEQAIRRIPGAAGRGGSPEEFKKTTGLEIKEMFAQTVFAVTVDPAKGPGFPGLAGGGRTELPITLALRTSKSFSQKKLAASFKNAKQKKLNGKIYYEIDEDPFTYAYMPSNRVVIFSNVLESQLQTILGANNDKPAVSAETAATIRSMNKNMFWMVMALDAKMRSLMEQGMAQGMAFQPPAFKPLTDAMLQAKAWGLWANIDANALRFGASVMCSDANAASALARDAQAAQPQQKDALGMFDLFLNQLPKMKQAIKEAMDSTTYRAEGAMMTTTAQVSRQTLNEVVTEIQGLAGQFQGAFGGGFPGGGQPGGGIGGGKGGAQPGGGQPGGGMPGGGKKGGGGAPPRGRKGGV